LEDNILLTNSILGGFVLFSLVAIGVSTGGPNVLIETLKGLHKVQVPIVIVQHISGNFPEMLVESLNKVTNLQVKLAEEGDLLMPNVVYLSKSDKHMTFQKVRESFETVYRIHYDDSPPIKSCKPSVDVMFNSLAEVFTEKIFAFIGTGMGNDGVDGVKKLKELNPKSKVVTQDEESSVVYGMNKAIVDAGLSEKSIPISELAPYLNSLVGAL
jgi:two-component system chemotaxis response regulator CheB